VDVTGTWRKTSSRASTHLQPDYWGQWFEHNSCQSRYYDLEATRQCLANKRVRFLGDSNLRRLLKMLWTENSWCTGQDYLCQSEDFHDTEAAGQPLEGYFGLGCDNKPLSLLDSTNVTFSFVGGLRTSPGCDLFADLESVALRREGRLKPALAARDEVDLIVASVLSWELGVRCITAYCPAPQADLICSSLLL